MWLCNSELFLIHDVEFSVTGMMTQTPIKYSLD